jgi:peptidoglycan hydrolase CwlO-like protein
LEFSQNLKSNNSFILIFKLKVTEHEQRIKQSEINLKEATNVIESLRTIIKENEESLEGFYVSLFKNINYT